MTVSQAQQLMELLLAAYPEVHPREETFPTYVRFLLDLEYGAASEAVEDMIAVSPKLPTIASVRRRVLEGELELPTAAEAWMAINDPHRQKELHALAKEARDLIGGAWAVKTSENPSITRSQYLRIFDDLREQAFLRADRSSRRGRGIASAE